jgi:hypothetical protein
MTLRDEALEDASRTVAIANAMLAAKHHDPRRTSVGLLAVAEVLLKDDMIGRITLATLMAESIAELLAGVEPELLRTDAKRMIAHELLH